MEKIIQPKVQVQELKKPKQKTKVTKFKYISRDILINNLSSFIQFFEQFWRLLFLLVTLLMLVLANKIYLFHTLQEFKGVKKGDMLALAYYSLPFAFLYLVIDNRIHRLFDDWAAKNLLRTDKYTDPVTRKKKGQVIVRLGFNIVYYFSTSIAGYIIIKDTSFMPPLLGGSGSVYSLGDNRYLENATFAMEVYYFIQLGKHIGRTFSHVFIQADGGYYEFLLHHTMSTFLLIFSYGMDMWVIGIFVLFVHDLPDGVLSISRLYRQLQKRNAIILNISYVLSITCWIGFRFFVFGYCCVYASWYQYFERVPTFSIIQQEVFKLPYAFMTGMLTCLVIMHTYWTYILLQYFFDQLLFKNSNPNL